MATLYFKVEADYDKVVRLREEISRLEAQMRTFGNSTPDAEIKQTEQSLAASRQEFTRLTTEAARAGAEMESGFKTKIYAASQSVNDLTSRIIAQKTAVREAQNNMRSLAEAYREAVKANRGGDNTAQLSAWKSAKQQYEQERAALFSLTQQQANARLSVKQLRDEYELFKRDGGESIDVVDKMTSKMTAMAATIAGGMGIKDFIGKVVQVRGEFENIETSLRVLLGGSEEKMQNLLGQLKEYALISPLTTKDMAGALQMMIGFGINADDSVKYLKALGDVSMGDATHFNSLALAFSQMSAAGKLMGQDLNQMINAGFNPLEQMSKTTGKSIGELKDEMSKGAISAEMVQQAFVDATSQGGKFYGMASEGAKTINGQMSMLEESFDNVFNDIGTKSEGLILKVISGATSMVENYESIGRALIPVITAFGTYKAAVMAAAAIDKLKTKAALTGINQEIEKIDEEIAAKQELMGMNADGGGASRSSNPEVAAAQEKLAAQKAVNAALDEEMQKRNAIAQQELADAQHQRDLAAAALDMADQENIEAQTNLSTAIEAKQAADDKVEAAKEYLDTIREATDVEEDDGGALSDAYDQLQAAVDEQAAAAKDVETASEAANTAEKNLNTAAQEMNTAETALNTAQTNANTTSQNLNSASNIQASVTTKGKTLATASDTAATTGNTLATKLNAIGTKVAAGAQALWTVAVNASKQAVNGLKAAIASNPLGLLITAVTTVISLFWSLNAEADEASENVEKFGESASKSLNRVNTLSNELKGLTSGTATHKKVLDELNGILKDYGAELINEGDNIDTINRKRTQAIELIKQEGIERQRLNNIEQGVNDYQKALDDARGQLLKDMQGAETGFVDSGLVFAFDNDELQNNAEAISAIVAQTVEENINLIADKTGKEYQEGYSKIIDSIKDKMKAIGISQATIDKTWWDGGFFTETDLIDKYIGAVKDAKEANDSYTTAVNKAAEAEKAAADKSMTFGQKVAAVERKLQGPTQGVHDLYKNIRQLMEKYSDNNINFHLNFDGKVPAWMNDKSIPVLQRLAKRFTAIGESMKDNEVKYVNGKRFTKEQALQRGLDYAKAAEDKQNAIDKKNEEAKNTRKDKPHKTTGKSAAETRAEADKRIAEENRNWNEKQRKEALEREYAQQQAVIDAMKEGNAKKLAQLKLDHKKELDQLDQQERELLRAKQEHQRKVYEAKPKNKGKDFTKTAQYKNIALTAEEKSGIEAKRTSANIKYNNDVAEIKADDTSALNAYLKEYGTFQQKKLAIAQEYAKKIADAQSEGEKMSLRQQQDKDTRELENNYYKDNTDWQSLFGDIGNRSVESLNGLKTQLKEQLSRSGLSIEDYKALVEQIDKVNDAIVDAQAQEESFFTLSSEHTKREKKLQMELNEAIEQEKRAKQDVQDAQNEKGKAQTDIAVQMITYGIDMGKPSTDISEADAQDAYDKVADKFGPLSNEAKTVSNLFITLAGATRKLTDATDKQRQAEGKITTAKSKKDDEDKWYSNLRNKMADLAEKFANWNNNIQELPNLASSLGISEDSGAGKAISNVAGAANNAMGAMADYASGNYIGAAVKAIGAVKNIGSALGIGAGNAAEVAKTINNLTESNKRLETAIETLTGEMQKSNGTKSLEAYKSAYDMQKEANDNYLKIAKAQASYTHAHHSFNYYWDGFTDEMMAWMRKNVKADFNGDLWSLSAEEMRKMQANPEIWKKIQDTGEGGYGQRVADRLQDYIDQADKLQELTDQINEKLMTISFDSMREDFMNTLMDMDSDAEDFADSLTETLTKAMVNWMLGDLFDDKLKDLYKRMTDTLKKQNGELTHKQVEKFRDEYKGLANDAYDMREKIFDVTGYTGKEGSSQSGTSGSYSGVTQEQYGEMVGRVTAIQIPVEMMNASIANIANLQTSGNAFLSDIRNLTFVSNGYLADIQKDTRRIYTEWSEKLDKMQKSLENL